MGISDRKRSIESPVNINLDLNQEPKTNQFLIENNIKSGDFVSRKKSGNIFAGSKLNVEGQGIYNVKIIKGLTKFLPKATPVSEGNPPTKTPTPTPTNTVTPTITPTPIYCYNFTSPNPTYYFTDSDVNVNNVYLYGNFTGYTNGYVTNYAGRIIRLNSDLTIDTTFSGGGTGFNSVLFDGESIIEQSDGKIIATGSFTSYNGTSANRIIRLNTDGSIDPSFVYGTGFNSFTQGGAIDSNGSIVITGFFNSYNGTSAVRIIRLLSNGLVDPSFVYGSGFNNTTIDVLINPDNGMYVVGYFSSYKGVPVGSNGIVKLLSNGSVDTTFSGGTGFSPFLPNNPNNIVRISGETSFYVAGYSTSYNGTLINRIVKLNEFGGIDTSFTGGTGFNNVVSTTDIIWVNKIFLTGAFTSYNGNSCLANCIILNSDGSVLHSFNDSNFTNFFVNNNTVFANSILTGCIVPVYNYIVPTPTPTPTITNTPTITPTVTSTITPTPSVTTTVTPTVTTTVTPTPTTSPPPSFVSVWRTTGSSESITLPYIVSGTYSGTIDWGDSSTSTNSYANRTHTYSTPGDYTVTIYGTLNGWSFNNTGDKLKIREILRWGPWKSTSVSSNFYGCSNLVLTGVTDTPDLSTTNSLSVMFASCSSITTINNINSWNLSNITNIGTMFRGCTNWDDNIGNWDVSNISLFAYAFRETKFDNGGSNSIGDWIFKNGADISAMFYGSTYFNRDVGNWNLSNVNGNLDSLFYGATSFNNGNSPSISGWTMSGITSLRGVFSFTPFNQNINSWDTSNVNDMRITFWFATSFNQPLSGWNTSNVTTMSQTFSNATLFNQNIGNWDVSGVNDMSFMFNNATSFNQNIGNWDVSGVTNFSSMFSNAINFNNGGSSSISGWTINTTTPPVLMSAMFATANQFNQPIGSWNVSGVTLMNSMFASATVFNQNLGNWNVSKVTNFNSMFSSANNFNNGGSPSISGWTINTTTGVTMAAMFAYPSSFNQPINNWDVSKVTNMSQMFYGNNSFNQPLSGWNVSNVTSMSQMFGFTSVFNQDIGNWNISGVTNFILFMDGKSPSTLSTTNLDSIYSGWSTKNPYTGLSINFGTAKYTISGGKPGRDILTGSTLSGGYGWTIIDGGGI